MQIIYCAEYLTKLSFKGSLYSKPCTQHQYTPSMLLQTNILFNLFLKTTRGAFLCQQAGH